MDLEQKKRILILVGLFFFTWGTSFYISTKLLMWENEEIVMPKVIGFPIYEAEKLLQQRKVRVQIEKYEETGEYPQNTVISQSVEPGAIVKEKRTVLLRVSKEIEKIDLPNLSGKNLIEAKKIIEKQNLRLTNVAFACHRSIADGKVISQSPTNDEPVKDLKIQLLVSSGPCLHQFVIGQMHDERIDVSVKKDFSDKGIDLRQTYTGNREDLKRAKVVTQEPSAGSIVKFGESVVLSMD